MSLSVLAVDDSMTIRDMLRLTLTQAGFTATLANDGAHGLEVLGGLSPDVIITDINMPRLDGFGLIEAMRERPRFRDMPILVLTTESSDEKKVRARQAGATGWIVKPFDPDRLASAIRRVSH